MEVVHISTCLEIMRHCIGSSLIRMEFPFNFVLDETAFTIEAYPTQSVSLLYQIYYNNLHNLPVCITNDTRGSQLLL